MTDQNPGAAGVPDLGPDVALLAVAAREAGRAALGYFGKAPRVWKKHGDSPVSEADMEADRLLGARLRAARPDYGWLSEETADGPERLTRRRVFVVDPIDGTRAFIAGDPLWAVSVAVVEDGRPIAAALYQPAVDDLMLAALGRGAWRGAARLRASSRADLAGARVGGPRRYAAASAAERLGTAAGPTVPSLALRFAHVADGRLDIALASARAHDWDLAAADLLVHEAGGWVGSADGVPARYNGSIPRHPALAAAAPALTDASLRLLAALVAG